MKDEGMSDRRLKHIRWLSLVIVTMVAAGLCIGLPYAAAGTGDQPAVAGEAVSESIESALFTRAEFFTAQALVPYPTAEARNRLADLLAEHRDEPAIWKQLAELDEKLGRPEEAEKEWQRSAELQHESGDALDALASFYHRRAQFDREAGVVERILASAGADERASALQRLLELARSHRLQSYLRPEFYRRIVEQNQSVFPIVAGYLDRLVEEKSYEEALQALTLYREQFPAEQIYFIRKEVFVLDKLGRESDAEKVYWHSFDPFRSKELADEFYTFLSDHERLRAYGRELREAFRRHPEDYDIAIRLFDYEEQRGQDYDYRRGQTSSGIFVRLEAARASRGIRWKPEELATVARLLIAGGDGDMASRFLYTLGLQGGLKPGSELRGKILYQLFELLSDAGAERIALTKGDLRFYQDVATADRHPGILGGVLSLVLADTDPAAELENEEAEAVRRFNRAAAYRVFATYRKEYPTSPDLAQMYLDLVRLYTRTREADAASALLVEFESRYQDAPRYPEVALKLADCYITLERYDEERSLYRRIMDYLGRRKKPGAALVPAAATADEVDNRQGGPSDAEPTAVPPILVAYPPTSNPGIGIQEDGQPVTLRSYDRAGPVYQDYLGEWPPATRSGATPRVDLVDYSTVLERLVASLARENRTADILALYSGEIRKYPTEQGLYSQMLQWLGQTNLVEDQFRAYQEAAKRFPTMWWHDRMARWLLRQDRKEQFDNFSRELLQTLGDEEAEGYLAHFADSRVAADPSSLDAKIYLGLYSLAHRRFPHRLSFVSGLLKYYEAHEQWPQWLNLASEYYFESPEIRHQFLARLARRRELRGYLDRARARCAEGVARIRTSATDLLPYKLFQADAANWLSDYEAAIDAYRELNRLYPHTAQFAEPLITLTRSLGQQNRRFLEEAATVAREEADGSPVTAEYRTRAGEIHAELGDYAAARGEWEKLVPLASGERETYLETATVYWDYFQYRDALRTIDRLRDETNNHTLYAFEAGAILEALHRTPEAIAEYVKALGGLEGEGEDLVESRKARRRLKTLSARPGVAAQLSLAFAKERGRQKDSGKLVLGYADLLKQTGRWDAAAGVLAREVAQSRSLDFLDRAHDLFAHAGDARGEQSTLKRMIDLSPSARPAISYRLDLARSYADHGDRAAAGAVLRDLLRTFPTNYGVLTETARFFRRIGMMDESTRTLRAGMLRGKGRFHYQFARQLAEREISSGHLAAGIQLLQQLHSENSLDEQVFHELAEAYVRSSNPRGLKESFDRTLRAIKAEDVDVREMRERVAELRGQMINALTKLKDYRAAVAQHIEIINRDPEDQEPLDDALAYVKRYGGADELLAYYQRTAAGAYKNYRWSVVLARICEAKGDLRDAALNYRDAVNNQPEMIELYDALAGVYTRLREYEPAISALERAVALSNEDPQYLRRLVTLLEQAGRRSEAEMARRKLPRQETPQDTATRDGFAAAAALPAAEKARAVEAYRKAFAAFSSDPYKHDLSAADLSGYVRTVRDEEDLDRIMKRLWEVRERLVSETDRSGSLQAGRARSLLQTMDGAIPEAVGGIAAERATGEELSGLFTELRAWIESAMSAGDRHGTLSLLQNLSRRAGFGSLEERILIAQKDAALSEKNMALFHGRLTALLDFYADRGAYRRVLDLLEAERARDPDSSHFDYWRRIGENARLIGDAARELQALRSYYDATAASLASGPDPMIERYFEALSENGTQGREELLSCARHPTGVHLQLINFLLRKGEAEIAHEAIDHATLPEPWKLAHHAELALSLHEFDQGQEVYFINALRSVSIGDLVSQPTDPVGRITGDDWFRLAGVYGRWLDLSTSAEQEAKGRLLLPAMTENRPGDGGEQSRLARWHLDRGRAGLAADHFQLALEMKPGDRDALSGLGSAFYLLNDRPNAEQTWSQLISGAEPSPADCELFLRTLLKHGLAATARERLFAHVVAALKKADASQYSYATKENNADFEKLKPLLRELAASFRDGTTPPDRGGALDSQREAARSQYVLKISTAAPRDLLLPEFLIREGLIAEQSRDWCYRLLIRRSSGSYGTDYEYSALRSSVWSAAEAEELFDQQHNYRISDPGGQRLEWQKEYLEYLLKRRQDEQARRIVAALGSELDRRSARPAWLRLAAYQLELRAGKTSEALDGLKHFTGVEVAAGAQEIRAPSTERLNEAVAMLRSEGRAQEAIQLARASYERAIALEQYELPYLLALARAALARGDAALGRKLLQAIAALAKDESRPRAQATLAALPAIEARAPETNGPALPDPRNPPDPKRTLALTAELAAEHGLFDLALDDRKQLLELSPDDETNRIELVRTAAAAGQSEAAVAELASIIGDRGTTRRLRWQAICVARELATTNRDLPGSLKQRLQATAIKDREMLAALEATSLSASGRGEEAVTLMRTIARDNPNPYAALFIALLDEPHGDPNVLLDELIGALIAGRELQPSRAFDFTEEEPERQIIWLYARMGDDRAALKLSEAVLGRGQERRPSATTTDDTRGVFDDNEDSPEVEPIYRTLEERTRLRQVRAEAELLELLSSAAERIGDLARAVRLEKSRLDLLATVEERRRASARLEMLVSLEREAARRTAELPELDREAIAHR